MNTFPLFLFKLFYYKYFLSGHNSKKQLHIFFSEAVAHFSRYLSEAVARSLKKHEIFPEKKKCSKAAAEIFTVAAHTSRENFHKLSMFMKTSMMVIKPKALYVPWPILLFHRPAQASYHRLYSELSYPS